MSSKYFMGEVEGDELIGVRASSIEAFFSVCGVAERQAGDITTKKPSGSTTRSENEIGGLLGGPLFTSIDERRLPQPASSRLWIKERGDRDGRS
jgi:hypothetical protein